MKLRLLGNTGVYVSELCLGAMNFGMPDWGVDENTSRRVIDAYLSAGGNFIDTADVYGGGASEEFCGRVLAGRRDEVIIASKGHFAVTRTFGEPPAHVNAQGSSRRHLVSAVEASLRRLQTDYIDLYQVHCWDEQTPIEETLSTLDQLIKSGKVRYAGLSNFTAWQIAESRQLCIRHGWEPLITAQMQYSLICRDIELGVIDVCRRHGIGILPWSPLGQGVLTGKYQSDLTGPADSRFGPRVDPENGWRAGFVNERNLKIADQVQTIAGSLEASPAAVAVAWLLYQPQVSSVIVGPKSEAQLTDNLAACDLKLEPGHLAKLDAISVPQALYPDSFVARTPRNQSETS